MKSVVLVHAIAMVCSEAFSGNRLHVNSLKRQQQCYTNLSAVNRRRDMLFTACTAASLVTLYPHPVLAGYGDSADLKGFDYIEFLVERNKVADPSTFVYGGADRDVQLQRLVSAAQALQQIPNVAHERKWSQVQGILTGPLGTLVQTMNQVVVGTTETTQTDFGGTSSSSQSTTTLKQQAASKAAAQKVKADLFAIGQAATKKNESQCVEATDAALKDLEAFVKLAF